MRAASRIITGRARPALDGLPAPSGCYSFRRLLSSYRANKAINVIRASDSATLDIGFAGDGKMDVATLTAFLSGTTGKVVTWYDQSGNGRDLTQATDGNRPALVLQSLGIFPSMQFTAATQTIAAAGNITPATGVVSLAMVANRVSGTGVCALRENATNNRIQTASASANNWTVLGGTSGSINRAATDNVWHAGVGVINGASSFHRIDGSEAGGTTTGNTTAGAPAIAGANSTTCNVVEGVIWDNVALAHDLRVYYSNNARAAWGF